MQIHQIKNNQKKNRKRVGRGGKRGTYSGKGMKGQKSRSGYSQRATFEGGHSTLIEHTKKKRGFSKAGKNDNLAINLKDIEAKFNDGEKVSMESLVEKKMIKDIKTPIKILADGKLTKKVVFDKDLKMSKKVKSQIDKIEK